MKEKPKVKISEEADQFDAENELWDSKKLGASPENARRVPDAEDKALDAAMGLQLLTIRLQKGLIEQFKEFAKLEGIGYQPLMRQVLTRYAKENEHRLETLTIKKKKAV